MLKISQNQLQAFCDSKHHKFVDRFVEFFNKNFPPDQRKTWGHATEPDLYNRVILGISRATKYGFITEVEQFDYLMCIMELGDEFDQNPQYPWAIAILNDVEGLNRSTRLSSALDLQLLLQELL